MDNKRVNAPSKSYFQSMNDSQFKRIYAKSIRLGKETGYTIRPSNNPFKKMNVEFNYGGEFYSVDIGSSQHNDYFIYLQVDPSKAEQKRINYYKRHERSIKGFKRPYDKALLSWIFLWDGSRK